jgi:hypothetical protein
MYFTIRGRVDSFEDSSYERTGNEGTPEQAKQQEALLSALEGGNDTANVPLFDVSGHEPN